MISVRDLTKQFGVIRAVHHLTFEVQRGEILGFLGPNGAGKTTTMRILTGFLNPTLGLARVCGFDVVDSSLEVRRRIGYLPEHSPVYSDMTVLEFLCFVAEARDIPRSRRPAAVSAVVEECGLGSVLGRVIGNLSKGFRQRTCLAQALVHRPEVLILDEPTSGLDPNQIVEIRDLVRQLGRERAVIWSTHILSEVEALCDRVLIINEGAAVAHGTPDELRARLSDAMTIRVSLRATAQESRERLLSLGGVREVRQIDEDGVVVNYEVECDEDVDLREPIFDLAAASGWKIRTMVRAEPTVEDVFRYLTGKSRN